jgi:tripartite-type tricarboxylate transporter receptor subunit TctC
MTFTNYVIVFLQSNRFAKFILILIFNMKKFISLLLLSVCSLTHAEYTAQNKIIKVVIPQPPTSGLGTLYLTMENYAKKQNITMIPVFKPGANAKIGLKYASEQKNDGNTLLLSTVSDFVQSANPADFNNVAPITKVDLMLVASKKSKIKTSNDIIKQEKENPGKLTWAHASSAQITLIDNFLKTNNIDPDKIYKIPFNGTYQTSIGNGDVDIGFILPTVAESLALKNHITIVDIDEKTKQKMATKENATALFLPKNSTKDSIKFWNKFVNDLLSDTEFAESLKGAKANTFTDASPERLTSIINNWKL